MGGSNSSGIASAAATLGALETQEVLARATAGAFYAILTTAQKAIEKELLDSGFDGAGPGSGRPGKH